MGLVLVMLFGFLLSGCGGEQAGSAKNPASETQSTEDEQDKPEIVGTNSATVRRVEFLHTSGNYGSDSVYSFCEIVVASYTSQTQNVVVKMDYYQMGNELVAESAHRPGVNCGSIVEVGGFIEFRLTADCRSVLLRKFYHSSSGSGTVSSPVCSGSIFVAESEGRIRAALSLFTNAPTGQTNTTLAINGGEAF